MRAGFLGNVVVTTPHGPVQAFPFDWWDLAIVAAWGLAGLLVGDALLLLGAAEVGLLGSARVRRRGSSALTGTIEGVIEMRRIVIGLAALFLVAAACSDESTHHDGSQRRDGRHGSTAVAASAIECYENNLDALYDSTALTIGTDNPAFQPWFAGTGTVRRLDGQAQQRHREPRQRRGLRERSRTRSPRRWASPATRSTGPR